MSRSDTFAANDSQPYTPEEARELGTPAFWRVYATAEALASLRAELERVKRERDEALKHNCLAQADSLRSRLAAAESELAAHKQAAKSTDDLIAHANMMQAAAEKALAEATASYDRVCDKRHEEMVERGEWLAKANARADAAEKALAKAQRDYRLADESAHRNVLEVDRLRASNDKLQAKLTAWEEAMEYKRPDEARFQSVPLDTYRHVIVKAREEMKALRKEAADLRLVDAEHIKVANEANARADVATAEAAGLMEVLRKAEELVRPAKAQVMGRRQTAREQGETFTLLVAAHGLIVRALSGTAGAALLAEMERKTKALEWIQVEAAINQGDSPACGRIAVKANAALSPEPKEGSR
jgi:hypothetical protein